MYAYTNKNGCTVIVSQEPQEHYIVVETVAEQPQGALYTLKIVDSQLKWVKVGELPPVSPPHAQEIAALKSQLTATDYQIIKCSECQLAGEPLPYDIEALHSERQALREEINGLEQNINQQ